MGKWNRNVMEYEAPRSEPQSFLDRIAALEEAVSSSSGSSVAASVVVSGYIGDGFSFHEDTGQPSFEECAQVIKNGGNVRIKFPPEDDDTHYIYINYYEADISEQLGASDCLYFVGYAATVTWHHPDYYDEGLLE